MHQNQPGIFRELKEETAAYAEDRLLLLQLSATKKTARLVATLTSFVVLILLIFFVLLFGSILAGRYLSDLTGNFYIGFGFITCIYALLTIILLSLKKQTIERKVANVIVRLLMDKTAEGGDHVN